MSDSLRVRVVDVGYWDVRDGKIVASVRVLPVDHLGWVNGGERTIVVGYAAARRLVESAIGGEPLTITVNELRES